MGSLSSSKAKELAIKAVIGLLTPLVIASVTATAAILWNMQPTMASNVQRLDKVEQEVHAIEKVAKEASDRQVDIRLRLERMDEKLDTLVEASRSEQ